MKILIILFFATVSFTSTALEYKRLPSCYLLSDSLDTSLPSDSAMYTFEFNGLSEENTQLIYSSGTNTITYNFENEHTLKLILPSGKYKFEFYISGYDEIVTGKLEIQKQHHSTYRVQMEHQVFKGQMKKPVIYLYPKENLEVSVQLNIHGQDPFYYPEYKNSWSFTADPTGQLKFGESTYNYLFWEANMDAPKIDHNYGFMVEGDNTVTFLEEQLNLMGFTSKEQADFITFWGPQLTQNKLNYVNFIFNEACDEFAELSISPQPDNIFRVSMIWQPVNEPWELESPLMEKMNRNGFTVLEWGGMELPAIYDAAEI